MNSRSNVRAQFTSFGSVFLLLAVLFSISGITLTPAEAALAGTALQFNGSTQYATYGNTSLTQGTLTGTLLGKRRVIPDQGVHRC